MRPSCASSWRGSRVAAISTFLNLLPVIVGAGVVPIWAIMVLFLLRGEGGLVKAVCFAAGGIAVRLVQGVMFAWVFGSADQAGGSTGSSLIVSTLLLVVGILMLLAAYKQWRKEDDPDGPPPKWIAKIGGLSAGEAFGTGALLVAIAAKQWVFTLSAIGIIGQAQTSVPANIALFLVYVAGAEALVLAPIMAYAVAPGRSAKVLAAVQGWLERHNRVIVIVVSLGFGALFVVKGVSGLLG